MTLRCRRVLAGLGCSLLVSSCGLVLDFDPEAPKGTLDGGYAGMDATPVDARRDMATRDTAVSGDDAAARDTGADASDAGRDGGPIGPDAGCACDPELSNTCVEGECKCGPERACSPGELCCPSPDSTELAGCVDPLRDALSCGGCGNACGPNARCEAGSCVCDDGFAACGEDPRCETVLSNDPAHCGACDSPCPEAQPSCVDGVCVACARDVDCGDPALECLAPSSCERAAGRCVPGELLSGHCLIDGVCFRDGDENPDNRCERCAPDLALDRWSASSGRSCDDGRDCTSSDRCDATGRCAGAPSSCDDFDSCTDDRCDVEVTGMCRNTLAPGYCRTSGGTCLAGGAPVPGQLCMQCDGSTGALVPAPAGAPCDDTDLCNGRERCDGGGRCVAGTATSCPATLPTCFRRACNPATGMCDQLRDGYCFLDGACRSMYERHPTDPCLACTAAAPFAWRPVPSGTSCRVNALCQMGLCTTDGSCTLRSAPCTAERNQLCDVISGECSCVTGFVSCHSDLTDSDGCECPVASCPAGGGVCLDPFTT